MDTSLSRARSPLVDSWSCPTLLRVGAAGPLLGQLCAGRQLVVAHDVRFADRVAQWAELDIRARVPRSAGLDDRAYCGQVSAALAAHPTAAVVAVGGGSVLDPVRLAAQSAGGDLLAQVDQRLGAGGGLVFAPDAPSASCDVICVPTTLGTAAEVSPVAIARSGPRVALVVGPGLRARVAVIDPELTASLTPTQLAMGLVEPLARALVPAITGEPLALADQLAAALARTLDGLAAALAAESAVGAQWRLAAALTSASTHASLLPLGRGPFGALLWPVATELATLTGLAKAEVTARLLPVWLAGVVSGALGPGWGSPDRVATVLGPVPDVLQPAWPDAVAIPALPQLSHAQAHDLARSVRTRWPMFLGTRVTDAEVAWLVLAAAGAHRNR